jgi:hypothetical protein
MRIACSTESMRISVNRTSVAPGPTRGKTLPARKWSVSLSNTENGLLFVRMSRRSTGRFRNPVPCRFPSLCSTAPPARQAKGHPSHGSVHKQREKKHHEYLCATVTGLRDCQVRTSAQHLFGLLCSSQCSIRSEALDCDLSGCLRRRRDRFLQLQEPFFVVFP